jgi:hypothetical protein
MKKAFILMAILLFARPYTEARGQSTPPVAGQAKAIEKQQNVAPRTNPTNRPRLAMQDALKIAEEFIAKEHIDIAPFWLYRAMYILVADAHATSEKKLPGWHFWWVSETPEMGNYVEIFVDIDGRASRMPSM